MSGVRQAMARAAAVLMVAMVIAGLGGSPAANASSGTGTTKLASSNSKESDAPSGSPLQIGVVANITGPPQDNPERNGPPVMQAWAKYINSHGGLAGHPVQIVVKDTKADAPTAIAAANAFCDDPSIIAVAMYDAGAEFDFTTPFSKCGMPIIGGMRYVPNGDPGWYSVATDFPAGIDSGWVLAKQLGAKRVAEVVCVEIPDCAAEDPISHKAVDDLGMTYEGTIKAAFSQPDYTADCLELKQENVDYVFIQIETQAALRMIAQCKTQGLKANWGMTQALVIPKVFSQQDQGTTIHFALFSFPWFSNAAPVQAYRQMMQTEKVPEVVWATPVSTAAYSTAQLFANVIRSNASSLPATPTRADIAQAYTTVKNQSLGGLLPQPLTFTAGKGQPSVNCYWLGSSKRGHYSSDPLDHPTCDPSSLGN